MVDLLKNIFTWWNQKTFGTMIYTILFGKFVGKDEFDNRYYENTKTKKRWVIYKSEIDASKIPVSWYLWMHDNSQLPPKVNFKKYPWEKEHVENLTGTTKAHRPKGSLSRKEIKFSKKYESWKN
mgnify:CR=1 FL=1|tara:strand:- start:90 stop:461 length:372 start_codon:yes stop_codon:yes gene_type:complete